MRAPDAGLAKTSVSVLPRVPDEPDEPLTMPAALVWSVAIMCGTFLVWRWGSALFGVRW